MNCRRGFTLVELLVVLGIAAVLLILTFSGIKVWKNTADAATATGKMRQLCIASMQFAADNRGFLPYTCWPASNYPNPQNPGDPAAPTTKWYLQVHPYIYGESMKAGRGLNDKVDGLFRLPGFRGYKIYGNRPIEGRWDAIDFIPVSRWRPNTSEPWTFLNLNRLKEISKIPYLLSGYNEGIAGVDTEARFQKYCYHPKFPVAKPSEDQLPLQTAWVFNERLAVAYCDGHIEMVPYQADTDMYQKIFNQN